MHIKTWSQKFQTSWEQKKSLEQQIKDVLKQVESNQQKAIDELESLYELKYQQEKDKSIKAEQQYLSLKQSYEEKVDDIMVKYDDIREEITQKFIKQMEEVNTMYRHTQKLSTNIKDQYFEHLSQQDLEFEQKLKETNLDHQQQNQSMRHKNQEMIKSNELVQAENSEFQQMIESAVFGFKQMQMEKDGLQIKTDQNKTLIESLLKEVMERDNSIKLQDKKLFEFKNKVIELEKNKHIMAYRTSEMRSSLEPKEAHIEQLKAEIFKLEGEFEEMLRASNAQNQKIINQQQIITENEKKLHVLSETFKKKETLVQKLITQIHNTVKDKDKKEWTVALYSFYKQLISPDNIIKDEDNPQSIQEQRQQIEHLEMSMQALVLSSQDKLKRRDNDIRQKTMDNASLLSRLNDLRIHNRNIMSEISSATLILTNLQSDFERLNEKQQVFQSSFVQKIDKSDRNQFTLDHLIQQQLLSFEHEEDVRKGRLRKGTTVDSRALINSDKLKLQGIAQELEAQQKILQKLERQHLQMTRAFKLHNQLKGCDLKADQIEDGTLSMFIKTYD